MKRRRWAFWFWTVSMCFGVALAAAEGWRRDWLWFVIAAYVAVGSWLMAERAANR